MYNGTAYYDGFRGHFSCSSPLTDNPPIVGPRSFFSPLWHKYRDVCMTSHPEPIDADFDASTRERLFVSVAEERIDKIQTLIIILLYYKLTKELLYMTCIPHSDVAAIDDDMPKFRRLGTKQRVAGVIRLSFFAVRLAVQSVTTLRTELDQFLYDTLMD